VNVAETLETYRDFVSRWDGTFDHARLLLDVFDGSQLLDGATEAYYAEGLDPEAGDLDEDAAAVLDVLRDLGYEN